MNIELAAESTTRSIADVNLQDQINAIDVASLSCCDLLATSTGYLQDQINTNNANVLAALAAEATTRSIADANLQAGLDAEIADRASCCDSLQSQIDDIHVTTSCCETLQEQINVLNIELAAESTTRSIADVNLQEQINAIDVASLSCCDLLATSTGYLQEQINILNIELAAESTTRSIADVNLQDQINAIDVASLSCCDLLATSTGYLQDQINTNNANVLAALAAEATTRSIADANLQAGLDAEIADRASCCDSLQSQIDDIHVTTSCCETLQEQIYILNIELAAESTTRSIADVNLQQQINAIDVASLSCCDLLATSTGYLQDQINSTNANVGA